VASAPTIFLALTGRFGPTLRKPKQRKSSVTLNQRRAIVFLLRRLPVFEEGYTVTKRQDEYEQARHMAQMRGGEPEDWLDKKYQYKKTNGKWTYGNGEARIGNVIAEYMYQDAHREPYLQVQRTDTKQFPQSHWDGKRWCWGKPKGPKIPYYLPDLIEATAETPIYICEGEKDADSLTDINLLATCASEGAGKWTKDLNRWFEGKQCVYIMEDNDSDGRRHARQVAHNLKSIVNEVRIVALPDLPEHGDVTDWLAAGNTNTRERLIELCAATPLYVGPLDRVAASDSLPLAVTMDDFVAHMPSHKYIFIPTREMWPATSVNSRVAPVPIPNHDEDEKQKVIPANAWLDQHKPVEQMTWAPGEPMEIKDRLVSEGGWFERPGATCFNLYRPPTIVHGDPNDVAMWLDHIKKVYPSEVGHIVNYCAHRVQRPQDKINHALFLGGEQGIGKDTILEPVKYAVGPWNFIEVTPQGMTGQFNGYLKSVILRISEARDLGEVNRYSFYEHMKTYTASPPDVHRVNEKNLKEHYILNCNGTIITSNYKINGIYLPPDDRRTYVAWSDSKRDDFTQDYWDALYAWFATGGACNVAAYLATLDITSFNAKAPPPKTEAFWAIVNSNMPPEDGELADLLDHLGRPKAFALGQLLNVSEFAEIGTWLSDRKNNRTVPHKLENCDYTHIRNSARKDGRWIINKRRQVVYARRDLTVAEQHSAAAELVVAAATRPTR
jgi:hypothetical protein